MPSGLRFFFVKNQPLDDFSRSARDVAHLLLAREVADPLLQRHRLRADPIGRNGYAAFDERNQPREENRHQVLGIGSYQQFPAMGSDHRSRKTISQERQIAAVDFERRMCSMYRTGLRVATRRFRH